MLQEVAKAVQQRFGARYTYRIGGDEFVAFAMDEAPELTQQKLAEINRYLTEQEYHVSIGISSGDLPVEMDSLIKQAESRMYEEKRRYYQQSGRDRRNRQ